MVNRCRIGSRVVVIRHSILSDPTGVFTDLAKKNSGSYVASNVRLWTACILYIKNWFTNGYLDWPLYLNFVDCLSLQTIFIAQEHFSQVFWTEFWASFVPSCSMEKVGWEMNAWCGCPLCALGHTTWLGAHGPQWLSNVINLQLELWPSLNMACLIFTMMSPCLFRVWWVWPRTDMWACLLRNHEAVWCV